MMGVSTIFSEWDSITNAVDYEIRKLNLADFTEEVVFSSNTSVYGPPGDFKYNGLFEVFGGKAYFFAGTADNAIDSAHNIMSLELPSPNTSVLVKTSGAFTGLYYKLANGASTEIVKDANDQYTFSFANLDHYTLDVNMATVSSSTAVTRSLEVPSIKTMVVNAGSIADATSSNVLDLSYTSGDGNHITSSWGGHAGTLAGTSALTYQQYTYCIHDGCIYWHQVDALKASSRQVNYFNLQENESCRIMKYDMSTSQYSTFQTFTIGDIKTKMDAQGTLYFNGHWDRDDSLGETNYAHNYAIDHNNELSCTATRVHGGYIYSLYGVTQKFIVKTPISDPSNYILIAPQELQPNGTPYPNANKIPHQMWQMSVANEYICLHKVKGNGGNWIYGSSNSQPLLRMKLDGSELTQITYSRPSEYRDGIYNVTALNDHLFFFLGSTTVSPNFSNIQ